jgi:ribonuclease P protein component
LAFSAAVGVNGVNPETSLKQNNDFRAVYSRGKSAVSPRTVIYCRKNRREKNRVGFTVSRKLGNAVTRNRVRRRLREVMRLHASSLRQGYDLILVARTRAVGSDYGKLEADVLRCLDQLHLLKKDGEE